MQIISSLASGLVLETSVEPVVGGTTLVNGKFILNTPPGVSLDVNSASYLTPQNSGSLPVQIATSFLARYPNYDNQLSNFFLEAADQSTLDLNAAPLPIAGNITTGTVTSGLPGTFARCQVGRVGGPAGIAPGSIAMLPTNTGGPNDLYGALITDTIDITSYNPGTTGTDEVLVWWKVATATTSEDVVQGYNVTANTNTPVRKDQVEQLPTPAGLLVYASVDDGASWFEVQYLEATDLVTSGTDFRLAFVNDGTEKLYLLGYIVLFPNLP